MLFVVFLLDHCAVCYFYGFWLPLCHLQNLIISFWDFLALVALWWCTANVTFRNPSISFFSYLIKKIVYWLGSMFGVGDMKYMREAWWPSSSPSQWIDGRALVGELQPLLWRVIKQMLYSSLFGNLRMVHTTSKLASDIWLLLILKTKLEYCLLSFYMIKHFQWKLTINFPESSPYTFVYLGSVMVRVLASSAVDRGFEPRSGKTIDTHYSFPACSTANINQHIGSALYFVCWIFH